MVCTHSKAWAGLIGRNASKLKTRICPCVLRQRPFHHLAKVFFLILLPCEYTI